MLVEDDPGNVLLTQEALNENKYPVIIHDVADGVAAMAFLRREPPYADAARPDLVLLDLNLPKKDGREVLAEIKADPDLRSIPVVILTTSGAEADSFAVTICTPMPMCKSPLTWTSSSM